MTNPLTKCKLLIVIGTRPEAIKLAPVILAARTHPGVRVTVCNTGQHADMAADILSLFGIAPEVDLAVMKPRQSLTDISCAVLAALEPILAGQKPDWLVVQGDTSTAFSAALAGFYARVPVAHVEAGLRTGNVEAPWPEEMNRRLISDLAQRHFAPLDSNVVNLLREGIPSDRVVVTGNTGIDALKYIVGRLGKDKPFGERAQAALDATKLAALRVGSSAKIVLVTGHRRESFGEGFRSICAALAELAQRFPERQFVYPVHPNPEVRDTVQRELGSKLINFHLIEPLDYLPFVLLMTRAELILTDSGGIQEEAPSIGKRVIVLRQVTERTEGVETGLIRLAGTDRARIVADATAAFEARWRVKPEGTDVYGDGHAAERIVNVLVVATRR